MRDYCKNLTRSRWQRHVTHGSSVCVCVCVCVCRGGGGYRGPDPPSPHHKKRCQSLVLSDGPPPPPPPTTIPRATHSCTILHIMYMYIYHFLVSWKKRECDYWHDNRVGSVLSAAHIFYIMSTSQRACA